MYIPRLNVMEDRQEIAAFMQRFSFATIIHSINNIPVATHLPFHISFRDDKLFLTAHFARANDQWECLERSRSLVIFSEPHAYISPTNYEKLQEVPTWNYISVHAYGQARIIADPDAVMALLESSIHDYEASYMQQWQELPAAFKLKLLNGIVAFEIEVDDLQAKQKLSQNKTMQEQRNIIENLSANTDSTARITAEYMRKRLEQDID
ncbi:FMN-binding negative transcriptional regulator [Chitinophaga pinensis]|uniref:FMN-binding negative transcriptional regulator n=1 Tax=Chitinophaga pinensis (strain ATCC 43595 / DSM 2588 / LMG 13176 / NBRC 15968 / NCIMB 11800 / UQM 2034) TaxID=485918 RepID=A0A979GSU6_CHIPD|nr:FMN-binding negative transcriptional regulator [Chitinophaga pinensis]ACU63307.1 FMN-binding negative transcriptional regulator [Chitinophaga pinensis DSM 2588]